MMKSKERLVIIGNGMAGAKLVEEILEMNPHLYTITIIGEEPYGNYDRIKLVYKLKDDEVEDYWINRPEWYEENGIQAILGERVDIIDSQAKIVRTNNDRIIEYDKLVLALGSKPFIPPIKGVDNPSVFALRNHDDALIIRDALKDKNKVLVIGGGLLGLELAYALKTMGKQIMVSHLMPSLMERQLDLDGGKILENKLKEKGMDFIMETYATMIKKTDDDKRKIIFQNGTEKDVDVVIINAGIVPNKKLAEDSGIFCHKGILVNDKLMTSRENIFAIGECIEHKGRTWGLVAPVYEQARVLAKYLLGDKETVYRDSATAPTRLKCDIPVVTMGQMNSRNGEDVVVYKDPKSQIYKKLISQNNTLVGAILVGDDMNSDTISLHYTAKLPLPDNLSQLIFPGAGDAADTIPDASAWPDEIKICDCNGISAGRIRQVIKAGNDTPFSAIKVSRAGTGCGTCKNRVKALLVESVGEIKKDPRENYYLPGIPLTREELEEVIRENKLMSVSSVINHIPEALGDAKTRMGLDYLLSFLWKGEYHQENDSKFVNDRYHANIQRDGTFSVIPRIHGGVVTAEQLRRIADVAVKYNVRLLKVTGADRIGLYSVKREDLPKVWEELEMDSGHAYGKYFRAAKSCVGSNFCRFGLKDSIKMGEMMDDRYRGIMFPAKVKMAASGCPRNCAEATIKDFGVVATGDGWDLFIGGNGGAKVAAAQKLTHVQTEEEVFRIADRFFEYYRRHGKYHERTATFVQRVGFEKIKDAILLDSNENLDKLEKDLQEYIATYDDPWKRKETWQQKQEMIILKE